MSGPGEASPSIRELETADLPRVLELEKALFAPDDWSEGMYRDELGERSRAYRAIEVAGELVAWGGVYCGPTAEILTLGVAPEHRRRGHASRLLAELLTIAARRGAREVYLEVRADDPGARALYVKHGFEAVGMRPHYYPRSGRDALVMRLDRAGLRNNEGPRHQ